MRDADRRHDVSALTSGELERIKRDLQVSLSLAWPDSPARVPMLAHLEAVQDEQDERERIRHANSS